MLFLSAVLNDQDGGTKPPTDTSSTQGVQVSGENAILLFVSSSERVIVIVVVLVVSTCVPGSSFSSLSNSMRATSPPINSKAK